MDRRSRSSLALGLVLIIIGSALVAIQLVPGLQVWINLETSWPLLIIGFGVVILLIGLALRVPGMAVPACIIGGIGGILYWQNITGDWGSWLYAWTLIPGFAGVGTLLSGLIGGRIRKAVGEGGGLILISLVFLGVFGSVFGGLGWFGAYWPLIVVGVGLLIAVQALLRLRQ